MDVGLCGGRSSARAGMTLVEILIVVIVLGILALAVLPQIPDASDDARRAVLQADLATMRKAVERYYLEHGNAYPAAAAPPANADASASFLPVNDASALFVAQLVLYTDPAGRVSKTPTRTHRLGPYLKSPLPENPFNGSRRVKVDRTVSDITAREADGTSGWLFYPNTGVLIANDREHAKR